MKMHSPSEALPESAGTGGPIGGGGTTTGEEASGESGDAGNSEESGTTGDLEDGGTTGDVTGGGETGSDGGLDGGGLDGGDLGGGLDGGGSDEGGYDDGGYDTDGYDDGGYDTSDTGNAEDGGGESGEPDSEVCLSGEIKLVNAVSLNDFSDQLGQNSLVQIQLYDIEFGDYVTPHHQIHIGTDPMFPITFEQVCFPAYSDGNYEVDVGLFKGNSAANNLNYLLSTNTANATAVTTGDNNGLVFKLNWP